MGAGAGVGAMLLSTAGPGQPRGQKWWQSGGLAPGGLQPKLQPRVLGSSWPHWTVGASSGCKMEAQGRSRSLLSTHLGLAWAGG